MSRHRVSNTRETFTLQLMTLPFLFVIFVDDSFFSFCDICWCNILDASGMVTY